jgi:hypothetical protein
MSASAAKTKSHHVAGAVTAVDTTANTITVLDKKTSATSVISVVPSTKYFQSKSVGLAGLTTGDVIRAHAQADIVAGSTTVASDRIEIVSPLAVAAKKANAKAAKKSVEGTVVTVTPTLTISTDDGSSITITTDSKTRVLEAKPAVFTDVKVGSHVEATGPLVGANVVAADVTISAEKAGRKKK